MKRYAQDLVLTAFGLASSSLVAFVLSFMERRWDFGLYDFTCLFILPAGAFVSGIVASSGYYLGAVLTHRKPSRDILVNMLLVSFSTFFLLHRLNYEAIQVGGVPLSSRVSFGDHLHAVITHAFLQLGDSASTRIGPLGGWGYGVALIQVLGFFCGGLFVYVLLTHRPYCEVCSRYLGNKGKRVRQAEDLPAFEAGVGEVLGMLREGRFQEGLDRHAVLGRPKRWRGRPPFSKVEVWACSRCPRHWVSHEATTWSGNEWSDNHPVPIPGTRFSAFSDQALVLRG